MILLLSLTSFAGNYQNWPPPPVNPVVRSNYDGDTLTLENGDKVRLSWVNTPELKPPEAYGKEARDLTQRLTEGKTVQLVLQGENPRDGYGRLLAGITVDGVNLSIALLEEGLGHVFIIPPEQYDVQPLLDAQARAKAAKKGIWTTDHYQGTLHITSFHANAEGDDRENVNGEYMRVANISEHSVNLLGYKIAKETGLSFDLPDVTVPAGYTVAVHSGHGRHQADPAAQLSVYLGSDVPIWNNDRDRVIIYDKFGKVVDTREHEIKSKPTP
ncbi:MAG: thermonuclease family protein [Myxococcota bacterium]